MQRVRDQTCLLFAGCKVVGKYTQPSHCHLYLHSAHAWYAYVSVPFRDHLQMYVSHSQALFIRTTHVQFAKRNFLSTVYLFHLVGNTVKILLRYVEEGIS